MNKKERIEELENKVKKLEEFKEYIEFKEEYGKDFILVRTTTPAFGFRGTKIDCLFIKNNRVCKVSLEYFIACDVSRERYGGKCFLLIKDVFPFGKNVLNIYEVDREKEEIRKIDNELYDLYKEKYGEKPKAKRGRPRKNVGDVNAKL